MMHLRVEKGFRVAQAHTLKVRANIWNLSNTNTALALTMRSGSTFLKPTAIMEPRILEVSASYAF